MKNLVLQISVAAALVASLTMAVTCPLSGIKPAVYTQTQTYPGQADTPYEWYLNPCAQDAAPGQQACNPASGYFQEFDAGGGACQFSLTEQSGWNAFDSTIGKGFANTFKNADGSRVANVLVKCDTTAGNLKAEGDAAATGTTTITWNILLASDQACGGSSSGSGTTSQGSGTPTPGTPGSPGAPSEKSGCGGGCVFLIIIFVGPVIYIAIFVAWNFKNGKRGKELAPHPEFWSSIPGLIKDGCIFFAQKVCQLVDKIRGKSGGSSGGEGSYNEV